MRRARARTEEARYRVLVKISSVLSACAAISISQLAAAKLPFANDEFGRVERTLSFCTELMPESAAKFQAIAKRYVGDAPEQELAEARKTPGYKEAYESNGALLAEMPKDRVIEACNAFLKAKSLR
jgi:hypothetical protein